MMKPNPPAIMKPATVKPNPPAMMKPATVKPPAIMKPNPPIRLYTPPKATNKPQQAAKSQMLPSTAKKPQLPAKPVTAKPATAKKTPPNNLQKAIMSFTGPLLPGSMKPPIKPQTGGGCRYVVSRAGARCIRGMGRSSHLCAVSPHNRCRLSARLAKAYTPRRRASCSQLKALYKAKLVRQGYKRFRIPSCTQLRRNRLKSIHSTYKARRTYSPRRPKSVGPKRPKRVSPKRVSPKQMTIVLARPAMRARPAMMTPRPRPTPGYPTTPASRRSKYVYFRRPIDPRPTRPVRLALPWVLRGGSAEGQAQQMLGGASCHLVDNRCVRGRGRSSKACTTSPHGRCRLSTRLAKAYSPVRRASCQQLRALRRATMVRQGYQRFRLPSCTRLRQLRQIKVNSSHRRQRGGDWQNGGTW
jgi:hypothetical protein